MSGYGRIASILAARQRKQTMELMNHVSIDLETLGTRYNAPIIAVGAVIFNPNTGELGKRYYEKVNFNSALRSGKADGSTLAWWLQQSDAARAEFMDNDKAQALATVLDTFSAWLRGNTMSPVVWGNGATFDITILEHAFDNGAVGLKEPWTFWNVRDMRTLMDVAEVEVKRNKGVHHKAIDDAVVQAQAISEAWMKVKNAISMKTLVRAVSKSVVSAPNAVTKSNVVLDDDDEL